MKLVDRKIMRNSSDSKAKLGGVFIYLSLNSFSPSQFIFLMPQRSSFCDQILI